MKITLKRWEDPDVPSRGSQGLWLIQEIPGFYLLRAFGTWRIECTYGHLWSETGNPKEDQKIYEQMSPGEQRLQQIWGFKYEPEKELLSSLPNQLTGQRFKTRREAVDALAMALTEKPRSVIGETLGKAK